MTRAILVLLVVGTVVASGCVGLGGGGGGAVEAGDGGGSGGGDGTDGSSGDGEAAGGDGAGGGDGDLAGGFQPAEEFEDVQNERQMADYIDRSPFPVFRPGEYFRYEGTNSVSSETDDPLPVTLEIQSEGGGEWLEADVVVTLERGEETATFSQADESAGRLMFVPEFTFTQNGRSFIWLYRYNLVTNVDPRISELSVGDDWVYESQSGDGEEPSGFTFEVTERRTYAGQECLVVVNEAFDGEESRPFSETCVSPDVGMPLYFVQYQDDGTPMVELELVEYRR